MSRPGYDIRTVADFPMTANYHNRELSLLDFQERVLSLAEDPNLPILERAKFVAIVGHNLDEFFQVRVAGLQEQVATGVTKASADGFLPSQQLDQIRLRMDEINARISRLVSVELIPALDEHGIHIVDWPALTRNERKHLSAVFDEEIYPVLTPLAVDPAHPFPYISNLSMNLAVTVRTPGTGQQRFARIKVPPVLPRFLTTSEERLVPVEQVIAAHLDTLFPGREVVGSQVFRVTRSADQAVEEDEAEDLLEAMEALLETRHRFSRLVRLEIEETMPDEILDLLVTEMDITDEREIYQQRGLLDLAGFWTLYGLKRKELKDPKWTPVTQAALSNFDEGETIFDRIAANDILIHFPYDAFGTSVGAFIAAAAQDPNVLAIKQTLYRTADPDDPALGGEEKILKHLATAARSGKQVVVLVELKARFDEQANIAWARILEEAGAHVVYGVVGLKTHAKISLVVRREGDRLRRYSHIGTGNYNPKTAKLYEDLGMLTAREQIGADLSELFNALTGFSDQDEYRHLLVAPKTLRAGITDRIRAQAELGDRGRIRWKLNHLVDPSIIDELYAASAAGAEIDLTVRGVCCIRPGVPGLSDNIRVRSIIGRYLEHSRVFRFGEGDDAEYLIGSADMMQRNLNGRVEALTPIEEPTLRVRLEEMLSVMFSDDRLAWELDDDAWTKVETTQGINSHVRLQELALERAAGASPDPEPDAPEIIVAAGGIVTRVNEGRTEVLLVHRPRYDDWSFPKGTVDDGERDLDAAIREVLEETGMRVEIGAELSPIEYVDQRGRPKVVRYWTMSAMGGEFTPNVEVDEIRWLPHSDALDLLSYDRDRALLRSTIA